MGLAIGYTFQSFDAHDSNACHNFPLFKINRGSIKDFTLPSSFPLRVLIWAGVKQCSCNNWIWAFLWNIVWRFVLANVTLVFSMTMLCILTSFPPPGPRMLASCSLYMSISHMALCLFLTSFPPFLPHLPFRSASISSAIIGVLQRRDGKE